MKPIKDKDCRVCGSTFKPWKSTQVVCSPTCAIEYAKQKELEKQLKQAERDRREWYEKNATVQDLMNKLQPIFNKFIRLRDKGQPCISCGRSNPETKINAGHFIASGRSKLLTFNEDNVHLQCEYCNQFLRGNYGEYREGLIKKIGEDKVKELEANRHKEYKYTREELKLLIDKYKLKVKQYDKSK